MLGAALFSACALCGQASDKGERFELFNQCRPMALFFQVLDDDDPPIGLRREAIRAAAESRLRAARLYSGSVDVNAGSHQYWPYEVWEESTRKYGPTQMGGPGTAGEATVYVAEVRQLFRQPACVQGRFGTADERFADD